jgi:hypothetical protein
MTVTTMPLNLGALPAFSVEADRVFCLKYIVKVTRGLMTPQGSLEWKFGGLHGHSNPADPLISPVEGATYVACRHGWVFIVGDPDEDVTPICTRTKCHREARDWIRRQDLTEGSAIASMAVGRASASSQAARDELVCGDGHPRLGQEGVAEEGPFLCDTLADVITAEQQVAADIISSRDRVIALDLEGNLGGPDPHVALMQLKSATRLFVIDTHCVRDALAPREGGFRELLLDSSVDKVVH